MKVLSFLLITFFFSNLFAANLKIACGADSYEALENNEPEITEFYIEVKTRGPQNPIELEYILFRGQEVDNLVVGLHSSLSDGKRSITVNFKGYHSMDFTQIQNCQDLDLATGNLTYKKYVGGFAGTSPSNYTCSCLTE